MLASFSYPAVLSGTPKRCRARKTIACLIQAKVLIKEYNRADAEPAFIYHDWNDGHSVRVRVDGELFAALPPKFPLKTAAVEEIGLFLGYQMLTGGQPYMTARIRFEAAFIGRKVEDVWPVSVRAGVNHPLQTFTVQYLQSLPKFEELEVFDWDESEIVYQHAAAQKVADNIIAIDGQLFTRCNEPYAAFLDWGDPGFAYRDENLSSEHLDGLQFSSKKDCRYGTFWYYQAACSDQHVFPASMKREAVAFAEAVTKRRRHKAKVFVPNQTVEVQGPERSLDEAVEFDGLRFAKQAVVASSMIGHSLFLKTVRGSLFNEIEAAVACGDRLALEIDASLPARLLRESHQDFADACRGLRNRLGIEVESLIERVVQINDVYKQRL